MELPYISTLKSFPAVRASHPRERPGFMAFAPIRAASSAAVSAAKAANAVSQAKMNALHFLMA
jgi:hypothetical protein